MKKLVVFGLVCFILTIGYAQDNFWYFRGEKHYFEVCPNRVVILVDEKMTENAVESSLRKNASLQEFEVSGSSKFRVVHLHDGSRSTVTQLANQWKSNDTILFVGQVIVDETGRKTAALTNQINVRLKRDDDFPILQKAVASYDIDKIEQSQINNLRYVLTVSRFSAKSALQIANELHRTGLFEFAAPNLLLFIRYTTNDTHFSQQWGLRNIGQNGGIAGMDIRAQQAWNITTGSPNIRIAIIDTGVDLNHPDLAPNMIPGLGFDATVIGGVGTRGNHSGNPHGTAVAGIAAARGNNGRGIAGVAHNSTILPVYTGNYLFSSRVADGLDWARQNGARVINMSFGLNSADLDVNKALDAATAANIVLVAASGNGNGAVDFPASRPDVIAVGAIDRCGRRAGRIDKNSWYYPKFCVNIKTIGNRLIRF